jgi:hypothetical protein
MYSEQNGLCYYTGLPMKYEKNEIRDVDMVSIDRKNPKLGYTLDNIVLCRWGANQLKRDLGHDEFIEFCRLVSNNLRADSS